MKSESEKIIISQIHERRAINGTVTIHFTWHEKDRRRDKDNVAFAKKFVLDALQKCGVLLNDNNQVIAGFTDSFRYGEDYGVTVEIEVLGDDLART